MKRCFLIAVILMISITTPNVAQISKDKQAPDFVLQDLDGNNYKLSDNFGKGPILINFWATWCLPCQEEMKKLKKIYKKYHEQGLEILAISVDDTKTVSSVPGFINSRRYPFTVLLDTNNEVMQLFQANNPPYTALLNAQGKMVYTHSGYRKGDETKIEQKILKLLESDN